MIKKIFLFSCIFFLLNLSTLAENIKFLNLEKSIEIALKNNKELKELEKNILLNKLKVKEVSAQRKITLGLQASYRYIESPTYFKSPAFIDYVLVLPVNPQTGTPSPPPVAVAKFPPQIIEMEMSSKEQKNLGFSLSLPLYTFGKLEGTVKSSLLSEKAEILNYEKVKNKLVYEVKLAYYNYLLAKKFEEVSQQTLSQAEEHCRAAEKRFKYGTVAKFDLIRADVEKKTAEENLVKAKKNVELARMNFNNTLGLPLEEKIELEDIDFENLNFKNFSEEECFKNALKNRPEINQIEIAKKQAEIASKISRLLPTIGLKLDYPLESSGSAFANERVLSGVIFFDFPLFDSGASRARVNQAKENEKKLKISQERLIDGIKLQIKEAILNIEEAKTRIITSEGILAQAKEALRMAEAGYKEGVTSNLELIDARLAFYRAKLNYIQAVFDYKIAEAKLIFAMGER